MTVQDQIDKLVEDYAIRPWDRRLLRVELEILVTLAEREQMVKDHEDTMKLLSSKKK